MPTPGIKPLWKHLLLNVSPQEQKTAAGIVLPVAVQGASTRMEAVVVECGPNCQLMFAPGDKVLVSKYQSGEIVRDGVSYKLALEDDIIAHLEDVSVSYAEARITPIDPGV